MKNGVYFKPK